MLSPGPYGEPRPGSLVRVEILAGNTGAEELADVQMSGAGRLQTESSSSSGPTSRAGLSPRGRWRRSRSGAMGSSRSRAMRARRPSRRAIPATRRGTNGVGFGNACDADGTGDGLVNVGDLVRMKQLFLKPPGPSAAAP